MMLRSILNFGQHSQPFPAIGGLPDDTLAMLEPEYHVAFHQLHGSFSNNTLSDAGPVLLPTRGEARATSVNHQSSGVCGHGDDRATPVRHTALELQQPARQTPTSRSGHILLSCPPRRSLILHGGLGVGSADLLNDTWEYLIDEQRWVQLLCCGISRYARGPQLDTDTVMDEVQVDDDDDDDDDMPPKAFGQCGTLFGGGRYLFVHGGVFASDSNDFPAYQLDIERRVWTKLQLTSPLPTMWGSVAQTLLVPVQEVGASRGTDGGNGVAAPEKQRLMEVVVLFGGMQKMKAFNTTYLLYLTEPPSSSASRQYKDGDLRVVERLPSLSLKTFPGRRRPCSTVCRNFFLFIFGGRDNDFFYNDLWVFNGFTRQWIMVREETPLRYMREFFFRPYDAAPGLRVISFLENLLKMKQDSKRCRSPTPIPQRSRVRNSSALWRTGAVMVGRGTDIFVLGGFTYDEHGVIETHRDVHAYNCVRHVWREVHVDENSTPQMFPDGYFKVSSASPCGAGENLICSAAPPLQESISFRNWNILRRILSICPDGRTMAAMCSDPVMPGFRFFMFGGRCGDEPSGELFDVRISMVYRASQNATRVPEEGSDILCDTHTFPSSSSDAAVEGVLQRLALSCFPQNGVLAREESLHWGGRKLRDQAVDWVRALLLEEPMLQRVMGLVVYPNEDAVVRREWLTDARRLGSMMGKKVESTFPKALSALVSHTPPFVLRG